MSLPEGRPYQVRTVDHVHEVERLRYARMGVQSPTGSGKTWILAKLLCDPTPQLVLTHRRILLDQLGKVLKAYGIPFGFRASGRVPNHAAPIQIALYQTEYSRAFKSDRFPKCQPRRVHIDEAHSFGGGTAAHVINYYHEQGASTISYTATPEEISHLIDELYVVATVPELIKQGYLVQPIVFGPDTPDLEKLEAVQRQANGEYMPGQMRKVWPVQAIFGSALVHYHKLNPEHKPTILYASGVKESLFFAEQFHKSGVRAAHIDGDDVWLAGKLYKSDTAARDGVFDEINDGKCKIVCNRYVLREGVDCPAIKCVIAATAFGPRSAWEQSIGRALRPYKDEKYAIVIDHGGNWLRHPPIDSGVPWDFRCSAKVAAQIRIEELRASNDASLPREPGEPREPLCCPQCYAIRVGGDECAQCGYRHTKSSRRVLQVNGELRLQSGPAYKPRRTKASPNAAKIWRGIFFGNKKNKPDRTPQQAWSYHAYMNGWNYLPRNLPLMPKTARGWYVSFGELTQADLIPEPENLRV